MQGTFVNLCYTMENHAIATIMTYFRSTDHGLGTEVDRGRGGGTSSKNRLESSLIYIYIYICVCVCVLKIFLLVQFEERKYFKMNKSANEFQCGILGFYFYLDTCFGCCASFNRLIKGLFWLVCDSFWLFWIVKCSTNIEL